MFSAFSVSRVIVSYFNNIKSRKRIFLKTTPINTMETSDLTSLSKRLEIAEENLRLINKEIKDIKAKILFIQTTGISLTDARPFSSNKRDANEIDGAETIEAKKFRQGFETVDNYVVVYTDGACENNGRTNAKAGIGVWFGDHHPFNVSKPVKGRPTNNVAEIQACIAAIEIAIKNDIKNLCIKTDSQFVINSITNWIKKWKVNNWKVANGNDVKNKEDFVVLDSLCQKLNVKWEYVPGHSNHLGNEQADALARAGATKYSS